jgi:hypothetical protein
MESATFSKNAIPVKFGLFIGFGMMFFTTLNNLYWISNFILYSVMNFVILIGALVGIVLSGIQQRKAMGGFITIKEAFSALFITTLIATFINAVYGYIYASSIDPNLVDKIKAGSIALMERMKAPEEAIDQAIAAMDAKTKDSLKLSKVLFAYAQSLVGYGIVNFIIAAIIKKNKPAETV